MGGIVDGAVDKIVKHAYLESNIIKNKLNLIQEEKKNKYQLFLPLVGGWVVDGIVDGAVDKIVKHVIWKVI